MSKLIPILPVLAFLVNLTLDASDQIIISGLCAAILM